MTFMDNPCGCDESMALQREVCRLERQLQYADSEIRARACEISQAMSELVQATHSGGGRSLLEEARALIAEVESLRDQIAEPGMVDARIAQLDVRVTALETAETDRLIAAKDAQLDMPIGAGAEAAQRFDRLVKDFEIAPHSEIRDIGSIQRRCLDKLGHAGIDHAGDLETGIDVLLAQMGVYVARIEDLEDVDVEDVESPLDPTPSSRPSKRDRILAGLGKHTNAPATFDGRSGYWVQGACSFVPAAGQSEAIAAYRLEVAAGDTWISHNDGCDGIHLARELYRQARVEDNERDALRRADEPEDDGCPTGACDHPLGGHDAWLGRCQIDGCPCKT